MTERSAGDVQLGAPDDHAVSLAVHHPHVGVEIVLAGRRTAAVALGVGDALGDAHVITLRFVDEGIDPLDVLGFGVDHPPGRSLERLDGGIGDVGHHPRRVQQRDHLAQIVRAARHCHQRRGGIGRRVIETVIASRSGIHGLAQDRVRFEVVNLFALEVRQASVCERFLVLLAGAHCGLPHWSRVQCERQSR